MDLHCPGCGRWLAEVDDELLSGSGPLAGKGIRFRCQGCKKGVRFAIVADGEDVRMEGRLPATQKTEGDQGAAPPRR